MPRRNERRGQPPQIYKGAQAIQPGPRPGRSAFRRHSTGTPGAANAVAAAASVDTRQATVIGYDIGDGRVIAFCFVQNPWDTCSCGCGQCQREGCLLMLDHKHLDGRPVT